MEHGHAVSSVQGNKAEREHVAPSEAPDAVLAKSKRWLAPEGGRLLRQTIRRDELHRMVPLCSTTIWEMEQRGEFPKRFYLAPRCVAWDLAEVEAWLDQRKQATQAEGTQMDEWPRVRRRQARILKTSR
jgi:predicted DNA-binding transcriptional regulator AlpA